jgi:hypothetical protein
MPQRDINIQGAFGGIRRQEELFNPECCIISPIKKEQYKLLFYIINDFA